MNQDPSSIFFRKMDIKTLYQYSKGENVFLKPESLVNEIAQEYRRLVKIKSPCDDELNHIEQILELAIYDVELSNLINQVDKQIVHEMDLSVEKSTERENKLLVNLRQWFKGIIDLDWQPVELVIPAFRTLRNDAHRSISRAKVIDLSMQKAGKAIALVMQLIPTTTEEVNIHLRLYPADDSIYLPRDLQVVVLDESGKTCMKAQARNADYWLQLDFGAVPEEKFSVRVASNESSVTEHFLV